MPLVFCLLAVVIVVVPTIVYAQGQCGFGSPCPDGYCCSQWGYCGTTDSYCGSGCLCDCPNGPSCDGTVVSSSITPTEQSCPLDLTRKDSFVIYWGQGAGELSLRSYCSDASYDVFQISFLNNFPTSGGSSYPTLDLAGHCSTYFSDWNRLLHCPAIASDIKYCQANNKTIMLALGGAIGTYGFSSQQQATAFSQTIWDMFLGGYSTHRPFDDAVLNGVDLDIEGGSYKYYSDFVNQLHTLMLTDKSHKYYISAAPQCPYPDSFLGPDGADWSGAVHTGTAFSGGWFDFVAVQFYNNPPCNCGTSGFLAGSWSFDSWNKWANSTSINKQAKILVGTPGSPTAAGSGYQTDAQLQQDLSAVYSYSNFGGCMMWDAVEAAKSNHGPNTSAWLKSISPRHC